jgi:hypothetical protein
LIWWRDEGAEMRVGLNVCFLGRNSRGFSRGYEFVLYCPGFVYHYAIRLRTRAREVGPWRVGARRWCKACRPWHDETCARHARA